MVKRRRAVVVGAGIAGLAMSVRLRVKGYDVIVVESNTYTGGKLTAFTQNGFRFDAGPSLFTNPSFVEELFHLAGKPVTDYFRYNRLSTLCHYFYDDGTYIAADADPTTFAAQLAEAFGEDQSTILKYLKHNAWAYSITEPIFIRGALHRWGSYLNSATLRGVLALPKLHLFSTMHQVNSKTFKDPRTVQLFNRFATYNGSSPYKAPGLMNVIPHLEHGIGAFFPVGGMHEISQSIYRLAQDLGVQFVLQTRVQRILYSEGKVTGVQTPTQTYPAEVVVSNQDIVGTYKKLMPDLPAPETLLSQPRSSSALIFYWGIQGVFDELGLHNIFFSNNYKEEFVYLFDKGDVYHDPTVYINITSKEKPDDAPTGCENWFVMINVPHNAGQDWDRIIAKARGNIHSKLSKRLKREIEPFILCEQVLDPRSIEERTSSVGGSLYGNSSNNRYAAFLRHANETKRVKGLYFVGGSVHPGGGIPLALSSAAIADQLINN